MSIFSNLPEWNEIGTEPNQTKKDAGWQAGEKPPADWFNWLFNRTYESLIEVDSNANTLDDRVTIAEGDIAIAENELNVIDSNGDGKVDNADNADNATNVTSTYKDNDIDTNADGKVDNADNADYAVNADNALNAEFAESADKLSGNTLTQIQDMFYPVGSIYTNAAVSTNPGTLLGFGTWVKFGEGKVLVGQDGTDGDFNALGETGGSKTHTLTENEMPSHTHGYTDRYVGYEAEYAVSGDSKNITSTEDVTDPTGGDAAHNNVQPYITVKMWKRTE